MEAALEYRMQWLAALGVTMHACLSVYIHCVCACVYTSVNCCMLLLYYYPLYWVGVVCYSTHGVAARQGQVDRGPLDTAVLLSAHRAHLTSALRVC
eukprot:18058-Heterococcus_DN1.PRE.1